MPARVLVVDDILANVKLLAARLTAEYFEVVTASSGFEALEILGSSSIDVILLDVMMPGMDGFEVCRRIKRNPDTLHIPVVMVTALDQASDKVQGLEAGADDFLTKPVDEIALITRVRNLARLKALNDEIVSRMAVSAEAGLLPPAAVDWAQSDTSGRVLLVEDDERSAQRVTRTLGRLHNVEVVADPQAALLRLSIAPYDLIIVSLGLASADGLRLCGQVRSMERTRNLPIIVMVDPAEQSRLMRALDLGVNDYLARPLDKNELFARVRTQVRRKRHTDHLRERLDESVGLAAIDELTGLYNRRHFQMNLKAMVDRAAANSRALSLMVVDLDHFKSINDTYGHHAGDEVLCEVARCLRNNTRCADLASRMGGEEFMVAMPDTDLEKATQIGERLRQAVATKPFRTSDGDTLNVTLSVGIATLEGPLDTPDALCKRADRALYAAKRDGRNRVVAEAA